MATVKRSYLEVFFRHRLLLTVPILVAAVLAGYYGFSQPRKYSAGVTVFADTAVPNDSTLSTGPVTNTTPAANQQAIFTEFLGIRTFLRDVMEHGPDAATFKSSGPDQQDAALAKLSHSVTVTATGPHVVAIAVQDTSPRVNNVANLVARSFIQTERDALTGRLKGQGDYDKQQVDAASRSLGDAQKALAAGANSSADVVAQLNGTVTQAQQHYSDAATELAKSTAELAQVGDDSVLRVLDQADRSVPMSRKKGLILAGAGGLLGGLSISLVLLMIIVASDSSARRESDLEQQLPLRVVGSIAEFPRPSRRRMRGIS